MMRKITVLIDRLIDAYTVLGICAVCVLAVVTLISVFWRYVLNDPIFSIEDISTMALTILVASAITYAGREGAHLSVDLLPKTKSPTINRWHVFGIKLFSLIAALLICFSLFKAGLCGSDCGLITANLGISHAPFYFFFAFSFFIYATFVLKELFLLRSNSENNTSF